MENPYIAFIEDDHDDAAVLIDTFKDEFPAVKIHHFTDENGLWEFLGKAKTLPCVIVTDYYLKHLTADDLVAGLRRDKATQNIPVVVLSTVSTKSMAGLEGFYRIFHYVKPASLWDYRWLAAGIMEIAEARDMAAD